LRRQRGRSASPANGGDEVRRTAGVGLPEPLPLSVCCASPRRATPCRTLSHTREALTSAHEGLITYKWLGLPQNACFHMTGVWGVSSLQF
jgi:hypothetical protein